MRSKPHVAQPWVPAGTGVRQPAVGVAVGVGVFEGVGVAVGAALLVMP
ncbi:unannotated protein [freshwater metagenome]|uniref:Unannotated protein n=1 Tax=freshwater metagenome TaxID=449393 RepID=A0A6J6MA99_9ZZZZ